MSEFFSFEQKGLTCFRSRPLFGSQDVGISPAGPMDRLAVLSGNILLGNDDYQETLEIIIPPVLLSLSDFLFVLTGAHCNCFLKSEIGKMKISHGRVSYAPKGSTLVFSEITKGFRTIMSFRSASAIKDIKLYSGRTRGDFYQNFSFFDNRRHLRVLKGPEYSKLKNPGLFTEQPWRILPDSNEMGYRFASDAELEIDSQDLISDAVSDGTVQLTSAGPIVLLYHRQTVGGYPRIFNVISSDMDLLSQYSPGEYVMFKLISIEEAIQINRDKSRDLVIYRSRFPSE